jgi:ATP-dependent DNA helicase RecQ
MSGDLHAELRRALRRGAPPAEVPPRPEGAPSADTAAWRLLHAWRASGGFGADHAVLLRQYARWGSSYVGEVTAVEAPLLGQAGVRVTPAGVLEADPFRPAWLAAGAPGEGIDPPPVERRRDDRVAAEAYLGALGYGHWHSQAQKEAAWAVLDAPPGSSTLVALPTGSGKSLCFQLLPRFGSGLTVVVVPTVALDRWRGAERLFRGVPGVNPRYFAADDPHADPDAVAADVAAGRTRLVFTSPEACVSGRLRSALETAAREGRLENLAVDEAHIVESWGAFFRVDFQVLAVRQKQWLELSGGRMRTQLFSATFTPECRDFLRALFATGGEWREWVSQRLRPEPAYHLYRFDDDAQRRAAVLECAWRLPRPAVFYTTEVKEAEALARALRDEGFGRAGCFTGDTPAAERRALLDAWRADRLDLMVATSAFGMGVDKADVRAVVHACLPENLHRYYQEVGRSGRDGFSSVCLLLPSRGEERVARGMAATLIGEELAQERWDALWQSRQPVAGDSSTYRLNAGVRRLGLRGTRTWGENVAWNKRLLLLMQRAGWLALVDADWVPSSNGGEAEEWLTVRLAAMNPHSRTLGAELQPHREVEIRAAHAGLDRLLEYVHGDFPLCRTLARVYGDETVRACGGCPGCRRRGREPGNCPPLPVASEPARPSRAVVDGCPHPLRQPTAFVRFARRVVRGGHARRFVCAREHHADICQLLAQALGDERPPPYRVDTLESVPFTAGSGEALAVLHLDELHPALLPERRGDRVAHLVAGGIPLLDENGRYPFEADGARHFPNPDAWLEASTRVH